MIRRTLVVVAALLALPTVAAAQPAETIEYYQADLVGSIRIVYDAAGNVIGRQDYTPFGTLVLNGTSMPKEAFGGNENDDETQAMYFHARSLAGRTGRFNAPDSLFVGALEPQKWNRYAYALNNPIRFGDFSGLCPDQFGHHIDLCDTDVKGKVDPVSPFPGPGYIPFPIIFVPPPHLGPGERVGPRTGGPTKGNGSGDSNNNTPCGGDGAGIVVSTGVTGEAGVGGAGISVQGNIGYGVFYDDK